MRFDELPLDEQWTDHLRALDFAEEQFQEWVKLGKVQSWQLHSVATNYATQRTKWKAGQVQGHSLPADTGLQPAIIGESDSERAQRYLQFLEHEVRHFTQTGMLNLTQTHGLSAFLRERLAFERRKSFVQVVRRSESEPGQAETRRDAPMPPKIAVPGGAADPILAVAIPLKPDTESRPKRTIPEILLDPRNIQMLLTFGGALMVVGIVILLWVNEFFTPPIVAIVLGVANAALLVGGWLLLTGTKHQIAGRSVMLVACLVMPLNLWYYHSNQLITLDGHLWVAALVISVLYAISAVVLRDEMFVYVFVAGVTLTGLLMLADLPPSPQHFWEIAKPASMLVVMGLLAIHSERIFPEQEGPFGRKRFGLAFFWSGHAQLAAGLLLLLGAQVAGDWMHPVFEPLYQRFNATPSPIVGELRWLAFLLVIAGTYAYVYSDVVVRRVGVYAHIAAGTLLWSLVVGLQLLNIAPRIDMWIAVLSVTAFAVNSTQMTLFRNSRHTRSFPVLGVLLPLAAVVLGVVVYVRALSPDLKSIWQVEPPSWTYVAAMLLTAISCRYGAFLYRRTSPGLASTYFIATAAATLLTGTAFLSALGLNSWREHAPWLMLIPTAYLVAARLNRGHTSERPLLLVAHVATLAMLVSSFASGIEGFAIVHGQPLNLVLALFYAEAALFYLLAAWLYKEIWTIHLCAAMACGTVWQLLTYWSVNAEYYTLTFAVVGLVLMIVYRLAVLERFSAGPISNAAFQSANTLLSLSFVAALFLGLSHLATSQVQWSLVRLFAMLTVIAAASVVLVQHMAWRRWYVVTTVAQGALTFLGMTVLSELTIWQKVEIFSIIVGLLLLVVGHVGWYREQERQSDMVTVCLFFGSVLLGAPLAIATIIDRSQDHFIVLNELGFLLAAILLVTTGFLFQLKSTTLTGVTLILVYFVTLLIFVPWGRLGAIAIFMTAGGGTLFLTGLLLSVYRDRLLALPEKVKQRRGLFQILNWR